MSGTVRDQVEGLLDDMGMDGVEIPEDSLDFNPEERTNHGVNLGVIHEQAYRTLDPAAEPRDRSLDLELDSGIQVKLDVSYRPACENCGKPPFEDFEEIDTRDCAECETTVCSCAAYCHTCDNPLCSDCRTGYSDEGLVLCEEHKEERYQERQFEAQFQVWAKKLEQKLQVLDRDLEFRRAVFDKEKEMARIKSEKLVRLEEVQQQRDAKEIELKKKQLEESRHAMAEKLQAELQRRKQRLERFKKEVDAEIEHRKQNVEEYKAVTEREEKRERRRLEDRQNKREEERKRAEAAMEHERELEAEKRKQLEAETDRREVENQFQVDMREQEIKEMEKKLDARIEILEWAKDNKELEHDMRMDEAELAMKKREKAVEIAESMQELRWNEVNEFLDVQGRLQNEGFEPLNPPEDDDGGDDDDEPVIVLEPGEDGKFTPKEDENSDEEYVL